MTSPPIITLSGGESYQSVDLNAPITTVTYTASSATDIYLYSGTFPTGVTGSASGLAFTVQGTPSTAGEYNYSVAAYRYGCENVFAYGQIKANAVIPQYAASANTWVVGNQTWSDVISIPDCNKTGFSVPVSSKNADCRNNPGYDGYLYSWYYVDNNASTLCTYPWRVPSVADFCTLDKTLFSTSTCSYRSGSMDYLIYNGAAWGGTFGGLADGSWGTVSGQGDRAYYWSSEIMTGNGRTLQYTSIYDTVDPGDYISATYGLQVRCVKSSSWY
jgi:uncharacterized protein (TIGR02145 family)